MSPSYSSFKNDLISFNTEEYIKIIYENESFTIFSNFLENYKDIEHEDFKKPIFSQTSKFKKIPNNFKNYKYLKINRDNEDNENEKKNNWTFENPKEDNEKISILIKTYLNKISEDTYKKISSDFMNELILIKNINLFEILCTEILNKCLFDNKYRNLYINLCYKIWNNKQIHYNLIELVTKDDSYYWEFNEKINGPFNSELNAKNDAFNKINFKKYFLNHIQKLYLIKDFSFENLNEDEIFIKKKKILLLVELIGIIYIEKYINFDIINIIIIDLLHLNNNFKNIEDIEYEALYTLIKLIKEHKKNYSEFIEFKTLFNSFILHINQIMENVILSKRSSFFLENIILNLKIFLSNNDNSLTYNENKYVDDEKLNSTFIIKLNANENYNELYNIYKNINDKSTVIYKAIDKFMAETKHNKNIINFLIEIKNSNLITNILEKIIENIQDIMLDIPNANEKLFYLINNINYNHTKKTEFINILKNIDESDSDDSSSDEEDDD
jgi:hypothetical protein